MFNEFLSLFYPAICMSCSKSLLNGEDCICTYCRYHLPKTNYHNEKENPLEKVFWGRIPVEAASAYYFFNKGEKVQHLLHQLKYKSVKEVGIKIGELFGHELKKSENFKSVDLIVPVPLHNVRKRKRGYNQSEQFAIGLSKSMQIDVNTTAVLRVKSSETQTKKNRFQRWNNVSTIFEVKKQEQIENRHILLVDDVITTGATIEACASELLKIKNIKISIASIACA